MGEAKYFGPDRMIHDDIANILRLMDAPRMLMDSMSPAGLRVSAFRGHADYVCCPDLCAMWYTCVVRPQSIGACMLRVCLRDLQYVERDVIEAHLDKEGHMEDGSRKRKMK